MLIFAQKFTMSQNFDEIINREHTSSYKYDLRKKVFGTDDVFPMWVADTDFKAPSFIYEALRKRLEHGIYGYTIQDDEYYNSIIHWMKIQHGWTIEKEHIKFSPGVVPALYASVLAFTQPGDKVIVQPPVYYPFFSSVKELGRELLMNPLVLENGRYHMDLADLRSKIDDRTKMLFLCSPHNPGGNVWHKEELLAICNLCLEKNILIISDEIHADIVYPGFKHIPTATLSAEIDKQTITLNSPSKTFNIAGLNSAYIISSNPELLNRISYYHAGMHISADMFAIEATKAAYNHGKDWVNELITYFSNNINAVRSFLSKNLPQIEMMEPESTYLLWLDFRKLNINRKELSDLLIQKAKLGLSDGFQFGAEGNGFRRMNIGCPLSKVEEALEALVQAFKK
jgi:cysteine-S-conjugate beta-lyase